jgi:hypothetical protein
MKIRKPVSSKLLDSFLITNSLIPAKLVENVIRVMWLLAISIERLLLSYTELGMAFKKLRCLGRADSMWYGVALSEDEIGATCNHRKAN